jgi:hypothetical protein
LSIGSIVWGVRDPTCHQVLVRRAELPASSRAFPGLGDPPKTSSGSQLAIKLVTSEAEDHQRHHLDLYAENAAVEVQRLIDLGAHRVGWSYPPDADYVVLADPDGNTFCVVEKPSAYS